MRMLKYFLKKCFKFFCPQKVEKNHPQKLLRISQIQFFSLLPKLPKQKNLCSKMWPIEQLYIELGWRASCGYTKQSISFLSFAIAGRVHVTKTFMLFKYTSQKNHSKNCQKNSQKGTQLFCKETICPLPDICNRSIHR